MERNVTSGPIWHFLLQHIGFPRPLKMHQCSKMASGTFPKDKESFKTTYKNVVENLSSLTCKESLNGWLTLLNKLGIFLTSQSTLKGLYPQLFTTYEWAK